MTIKEAILKSLDEIGGITNYSQVYHHILAKGYYDFGAAKTPAATISAQLGEFIRNGDTRVKRIKQEGGTYSYYLTKNEQTIGIDVLTKITETDHKPERSYTERDLHILLSSYLKNERTFSKTIFHEQSNGKDSNQMWTHPDMVGAKFLELQSKASQNFLKAISSVDTVQLSSYEIKKEITSDSDLKKAFFQAVSNSSWANYGFLVALEFGDSLLEEMERLNQSFGIGVIELNTNPYQSKILFQPEFRELDIRTIDKLCKINKEFDKFIEQIEKLMTSDERYYNSMKKELEECCDRYFTTDSQFEDYCKEKKIPTK